MDLAHLAARSLVREAWRHHDAGRLPEMLEAARRAGAEARALGSLAIEMEAAEAEATAWRMLGRLDEALERLSWIVERAEAAAAEPALHRVVAAAWAEWAHCARLAGVPPERLEAVLDEGERALESMGRAGWRAALLHERARLRAAERRLDEALALAEEALALERRAPDAPGWTEATHRRFVADLLLALGRPVDAARHAEAVLSASPGPAARLHAPVLLARAALASPRAGGPPVAHAHADRAVQLGELLGAEALRAALAVRVRAALAVGDREAGAEAARRLVRLARGLGRDDALLDALLAAIPALPAGEARAAADEAAALAAPLGRVDEVRRAAARRAPEE